MSDESGLFPRPRSLEWGPGAAPPGAPVNEVGVAAIEPQGYVLTVGERGIALEYADEAGLRYGRQTLAALPREAGGGPRCCRIEDGPDFETRGYMLDVSRDRVPTRNCLERLVGRLAALRYNHLQLYTEHTFAYRDHETVWREASPITGADVAWLDGLCRDHGIELAANQNTFGHMERWLAHEAYRGRAETPDGFDQGGRRRGPTALAPTRENAAFALDLVRELLGHFRSRRINIGCDEVWELGKGASARAVEARGKPAVFVEHLRRLADPLLAEGYEVQFWADMVQKAPEAARPLAEAGAIAAVWGYEAPSGVDPSGVDFDALPEEIREAAREYLEVAGRGFGPRLASFAEAGFRTWVVPGTSGWNSFVGRHRNACGNLLDAAEAGRAHGAEGVLVTEWGDNGHLQPPFVTLPALAFGGAASWCRAANGDLGDEALALAVSGLVGDATGRFGAGLIRLGRAADALELPQPNGTQLFYALVSTAFAIPDAEVSSAAHAETASAIAAACADLDASAPTAEDGELLVRECRQAGRLAAFGLRRLGGRSGVLEPDDAATEAERVALVEEQRACWLARSRPGGLEDSLRRLARRRAC